MQPITLQIDADDLIQKITEIISAELKTGIERKSILTFEEARAMLGISKTRLYSLTSKREIPFFKPTGKLYFRREDLEKWVKDGKIKSINEQEIDACNYLIKKKQHG